MYVFFSNPTYHHPDCSSREITMASIVSHLTSSFLSTPGFCRPSQSLHQSQKQMRCTRKSVPRTISASIDLKPTPYALDALEPHMSKETLEYHWGKHQRGYVDNLNKQIEGTEFDGKSLGEIIIASYNNGDVLPAFNNAAQVWNHEFFWESMKPGGGGTPSGELLELINRDFGSFESLVSEFTLAATTQFGSGWAWLVYKEDEKLAVVNSSNAINPLVLNYDPLLTIDVWEHAYYLDFKNLRADYISTFLDKLVSWTAVSIRLLEVQAVVALRKKADENIAELDAIIATRDNDTTEPEDPDEY
ncbi:hypothetical protein L1987_11682 [Smallanthus sonchifolius]|uniref:Uncharacterized protein n=1 Tax=Smallanthus sonchifolius TaxID=185202 RepID=A0ACB9JC06_9ASTR|nr:hypothetical protein L1987_11682 [Smallanthus sonchifolius]